MFEDVKTSGFKGWVCYTAKDLGCVRPFVCETFSAPNSFYLRNMQDGLLLAFSKKNVTDSEHRLHSAIHISSSKLSKNPYIEILNFSQPLQHRWGSQDLESRFIPFSSVKALLNTVAPQWRSLRCTADPTAALEHKFYRDQLGSYPSQSATRSNTQRPMSEIRFCSGDYNHTVALEESTLHLDLSCIGRKPVSLLKENDTDISISRLNETDYQADVCHKDHRSSYVISIFAYPVAIENSDKQMYVHGVRNILQEIIWNTQFISSPEVNLSDLHPCYLNYNNACSMISGMRLRSNRPYSSNFTARFEECGIELAPVIAGLNAEIQTHCNGYRCRNYNCMPGIMDSKAVRFLRRSGMSDDETVSTLMAAFSICMNNLAEPIAIDMPNSPATKNFLQNIELPNQRQSQISFSWPGIKVQLHTIGKKTVAFSNARNGRIFAVSGGPRLKHNKQDTKESIPEFLLNSLKPDRRDCKAAALRLSYINACCLAHPDTLGRLHRTLRSLWLNSEQISLQKDKMHLYDHLSYIKHMTLYNQWAQLPLSVNYWNTIPFTSTVIPETLAQPEDPVEPLAAQLHNCFNDGLLFTKV